MILIFHTPWILGSKDTGATNVNSVGEVEAFQNLSSGILEALKTAGRTTSDGAIDESVQ